MFEDLLEKSRFRACSSLGDLCSGMTRKQNFRWKPCCVLLAGQSKKFSFFVTIVSHMPWIDWQQRLITASFRHRYALAVHSTKSLLDSYQKFCWLQLIATGNSHCLQRNEFILVLFALMPMKEIKHKSNSMLPSRLTWWSSLLPCPRAWLLTHLTLCRWRFKFPTTTEPQREHGIWRLLFCRCSGDYISGFSQGVYGQILCWICADSISNKLTVSGLRMSHHSRLSYS